LGVAQDLLNQIRNNNRFSGSGNNFYWNRQKFEVPKPLSTHSGVFANLVYNFVVVVHKKEGCGTFSRTLFV
jgi:hypothetical protein